MPFYKTIKLSLFLFLCVCQATAQNYPSKNYTAANELPNNAVRSLLVDSRNILWIGTENGVVKKENNVFSSFFEEDGLALNSCWAIAEDREHRIWFGSYGEGLSIYDGSKFKVILENDGLVHNEITSLFANGNNMYVGTSNGVSIIDIGTFKISCLNFPLNNGLLRIQDFFEWNNEIYVATYNSGIFKIFSKNSKYALLKINDHKNIYSVLVNQDSIYSSNKGFFSKLEIKDYLLSEESKPAEKLGKSIIWDYSKTKNNRIFAAAWGIYDSNGGIYEVVNNKLISRSSDFNMASKKVISLAYDAKFEKLYVGTKDAGLFEIKLNPQIKFNEIPAQSLIGFAKSKNSCAILFNNEIVLNEENDRKVISLLQLKKWQEEYISTTEVPLPQHKNDFYELDYSIHSADISFYDIQAYKNSYWINTNIGIFALKPSGELLSYLPLHSEEINFTADGELIETNPYGGARVYNDIKNLKYTYYNPKNQETPTMVVNSIKRGSKTYLLSIFTGLYKWENNKFISYLNNGIWKEKKLKHITNLGDHLAISNEFGDVFIVNDEAKFEVKRKISRAQIQGNSISFLKEYQGSLLIGTEKGLTIYNKDRSIFLDEEQGLKQPLLSADVNNTILSIGSTNGFYNIDLEKVTNTTSLVNKVKLEDIYINNNKFPLKKIAPNNKTELAYDENNILLKFSTNAHPFPHKLSYQYRLNSEENWSPPTAKPEIFLPFLPPNNYTLNIKVQDNSTGFSYSKELLQLEIRPPFWKTWWFLILILATLTLLIFSIYSFQIRQNKEFQLQKGLIQKRFEETKMEALLAQMNPHFIFNAMNSIQNYILDSDIDNATTFLGDFSKLIRLNLDHCTKPSILLIEEIEYLQSYIRVENTRFDNKIKVIFKIDPSIYTYEVEVPTMILQTFVENVFVHAFPQRVKHPTLTINFDLLANDILQCTIEDNGIGFSNIHKNKLHKSKGVSLVKERLALLGYDVEKTLEINTSENIGTRVSIKLEI